MIKKILSPFLFFGVMIIKIIIPMSLYTPPEGKAIQNKKIQSWGEMKGDYGILSAHLRTGIFTVAYETRDPSEDIFSQSLISPQLKKEGFLPMGVERNISICPSGAAVRNAIKMVQQGRQVASSIRYPRHTTRRHDRNRGSASESWPVFLASSSMRSARCSSRPRSPFSCRRGPTRVC